MESIALSEGCVVLEGGAREGSLTRKLLKTGAVVYAYEPHSESYAHLCENVKEFPNVHCINKAIWDCSGIAPLFTWGSTYGSSLYIEKDSRGRLPHNTISVEVEDIADIIFQLGYITLMTLDVEGAEYDIFKRIHDCNLWNMIEHIECELHGRKSAHLAHMEHECIDYIGGGNWAKIRKFN